MKFCNNIAHQYIKQLTDILILSAQIIKRPENQFREVIILVYSFFCLITITQLCLVLFTNINLTVLDRQSNDIM